MSAREGVRRWASEHAILLAVVTVAVFIGPALLTSGSASWHRDWHYFQHWAHVARMATLAGLPPDFNPWHCGGADLAANAQDLSGSPLVLFVVLFGPGLGLRMAALALVLMGAAGMAWGIRRAGQGALETWFAGSAWGLCVFLHVHISEGHVPFAGFALMPLALALCAEGHACLAAAERRDASMWMAAAGLVLGNQLLFGGAYAFPFTCIVLFLDSLVRAGAERSREPLLFLAKVAGLGALVGAPRLLPVLELVQRLPRAPLWTDAMELGLLGDALFSRTISVQGVEGHPYDWPEYAIYPGVFVMLLALLGGFAKVCTTNGQASTRARRTHWVAWTLVIVGFWLMLGDITFGLRRVLGALPLVGDLQVPTRYGVLFVLGCILLAARGLNWLGGKGAWSTMLAFSLALSGVVELGTLDVGWYSGAVESRSAPSYTDKTPERAGELVDAPVRMDSAPELGHVVSNCYEPGPHLVPSTLSGGGELPFLRVEPDIEGVKIRDFKPGLMVVDVPQPVDLIFAQSGGESWRVEGGKRLSVAGGLLSVRVEAAGPVRLQYWNSLRTQGIWIQLLVLAWLLVIVSRGFSRYSATRQSPPS